MLKPKQQRAYLRRKSARLRRKVPAVYAFETQGKSRPIAIGGLILAFCCLLAGGTLFFMAGRDYLYYAPVRYCAISFLEGLANQELLKSGQDAKTPIEIKIHDIKIDGNRATVNTGLAIPGNWVNAQLYAAKKEKGNWEIIGITQIDAHVENKQNLELANEIETAFRSMPGVQTRRY